MSVDRSRLASGYNARSRATARPRRDKHRGDGRDRAAALIALALANRPAAFLASGTMAFAYRIARAPRSFFALSNGGDATTLYCFLFLCIVFTGPGRRSLDAAEPAPL